MVITRTTKKNAQRYVADFVRHLKQQEKLPIQGVYLFGSYAKGTPHKWSDIDVAVVSRKFSGNVDPYEYLWLHLRDEDVRRGIEPIGFHPRDFVWENPLAAEVKQHGIKIKV